MEPSCFLKDCYTGRMDGIIIINKPAGMTSHDVISKLRRRYNQKKFGHTGTLDPNATGVLVILAGRAAKLLQFLSNTNKEYVASIELGKKTSTDDIWGTVLEESTIKKDFDFQNILDSFKGKLHQKVPATSAKKVNGKKLMEYQLDGQEVPEVYADVEVYDIQAIDPKELSFKVSCSGGTYIRSICRDFGQKTGNLACMRSLIRTKASGFTLEQAQDLDQIEDHTLYPLESVLSIPLISWSKEEDIYTGRHIRIDISADQVGIIGKAGLLAIYQRHHGNVFKCARGVWS